MQKSPDNRCGPAPAFLILKRNGKIDYDTAYEEVVADSMETMLADGKLVEKLAELSKKDKGIVKKIADYFKELADKIRAVYKNLVPESREGQLVAEMVEETERLQELFFDALKDVSETGVYATDISNQTNRFSFRTSKNGTANDKLLPYDDDMKNIIRQQGNIIVDSFAELVRVVNLAFDNPSMKATAYFGIIEPTILDQIKNNVPNFLQMNSFSKQAKSIQLL